jgi:hypothetical protein
VAGVLRSQNGTEKQVAATAPVSRLLWAGPSDATKFHSFEDTKQSKFPKP